MADIAEKKAKPVRRVRKEAKGRMRNFLMFLPNMVMLLGRLLKDGRVPGAEKALFLAAIVYVISPIDLIPDLFPFIGQVDDIYVVALTLLRLINRSDATAVRQHWSGGGDIVSLADSIAGIAPVLLPKRVSRVLSSLQPSGARPSTYECGVRPVRDARDQVSVKFYVVAMLFILFDLEAVFLYPWAAVFKQLGMFGLVEMLVFLGMLIGGLVYVWRHGVLDWRA